MAYVIGDTIEATHFNGFVTSVNNLWSTGTGNRGLGQTAVSSRSAGNDIAAAEWTDLLNKIRLLSDQYGQDGNITIDTVTNPTTGDTISALTTIATDIGTLDAAQIAVVSPAPGYATAVTDTAVVSGTFTNTITQTDTLTFASANAMRYFFNAGGRVYVSWGISGGTADGKYDEWVDLANSKCGTYYIYNTTGGKSGGSGSPSTNLTTTGFWDLGTGTTLMFKQVADTAPYTANYIQLQASLNAAAGSSTVMTLTSTWQDDAADQTSYNKNIYNVLDQVDGSKTTTFSYQASATTYISATWGTPSWATTVNSES